jgi:hypothetical protein
MSKHVKQTTQVTCWFKLTPDTYLGWKHEKHPPGGDYFYTSQSKILAAKTYHNTWIRHRTSHIRICKFLKFSIEILVWLDGFLCLTNICLTNICVSLCKVFPQIMPEFALWPWASHFISFASSDENLSCNPLYLRIHSKTSNIPRRGVNA